MRKFQLNFFQHLLLRRLIAYVIDCVLLFIVLAPISFVVQRVINVSPHTAQTVYLAILFSFTIPAWIYFTWGDHSGRGATVGKRLMSLQTKTLDGKRIGLGRAAGRTAMKMLPWVIIHISMFLLVPELGTFAAVNWIGLVIAYLLIFVYLGVAWQTGGLRSVYDFPAGTCVDQAINRSSKQAV